MRTAQVLTKDRSARWASDFDMALAVDEDGKMIFGDGRGPN